MNQNISIHNFSPHLFWDIDLSGFDLDKHKYFFICRVLEYGNWNDWNLTKQIYSSEDIKNAALNARSLDAISLSFIATIYNIDKTEFKCYKHNQLFPNLWNS